MIFDTYFSTRLYNNYLTLIFSLEDVLMQENKLYLVFEFLSMDLKRYMDSIPRDEMMDKMLVKSYLHQVNNIKT